MSPEKLEKRFEDKSLNLSVESPSKVKMNRYFSPKSARLKNDKNDFPPNLSSIESEIARYTNNHKNQIDYLKMVVYSLDKKLKV